MTPTDVSSSVQHEQSMNYTGEAKTECLVLCSGLGSLPNSHKSNQRNSNKVGSSLPAINNRLVILRNGERRSERTRRNGVCQKPSFPTFARLPACENGSTVSHLPQTVKVSVYTKAVNPYVVIYDSNKKYAKPAAYLRLVNCEIKSDASQNGLTPDGIDEDDCTFKIITHKSNDVDNSNVILTLRATNAEKRDEWVRFLTSVKNGTAGVSACKTGYVPGSSVLPTLIEQDDNAFEEETNVSESLKAPSRRKAREGRRNSLNSLGVRLRSYAGISG